MTVRNNQPHLPRSQAYQPPSRPRTELTPSGDGPSEQLSQAQMRPRSENEPAQGPRSDSPTPDPQTAQVARQRLDSSQGIAYRIADANRRLDAATGVEGSASVRSSGTTPSAQPPVLMAQATPGNGNPVEVLGDANDPELNLVEMNGEFIGADGQMLRVPGESGYLEALEGNMIQPRTDREPVVSGPVIAVNGVTVPATTASANAQRIADQLGAPTVALYNGPHHNFPNEEGRPLFDADDPLGTVARGGEFTGAFAHSSDNRDIDGQNLAQRLGRIMIEHIDSGATEPLTVVSHSEGASFTRAGFDVARGWLMERGMSAEEAEATLREHVDYVGLGSGSSRQSDAVDGVQYFHLDDRITGGLGLARNWGQTAVVFAEADSDNNHAAPGYINRISAEGIALQPGFYFQREDGQIVEAAIQREELRAGANTFVSHHLVAVEDDGSLGDRVWSSSPALDRMAAIYAGARDGGLPVETEQERSIGVSRTTHTIRLSDLDEMPPAFAGRAREGQGRGPEQYDPDWTPRAPNWPDNPQ